MKWLLLILLLFTTGCSLTGELVVSGEVEGVKVEYRVASK